MKESAPSAHVTLDACEREPLAFSGRIQDVGALFATAPQSQTITHHSANIERWFDLPEHNGERQLADFFRDDCAYFLHRRKRIFEDQHFIVRGVVTNRGREGDLLLSEHEGATLYEFEPRSESEPDSQAEPEPGPSARDPSITYDTTVVPSSIPIEQLLSRVYELSAYPKIMLYRFLEDGAGEVVAELSDQQLDAYQGLRFPSSDIPKIARSLYIDNPFRLIFDTQGASADIIATNANDAVIDLSLSTLRSVSPVHVEYLGNMGVRSSASFPVRVMGKLWGLLAMHAPTPTPIRIEERLRIVQIIEQELARRLMDSRVRENHRRFNANVDLLERSASTLVALLQQPQVVDALPSPLEELIDYDTLVVRINGIAVTPLQGISAEEAETLADIGARHATRGVVALDTLGQFAEQEASFRRRASGLLYATLAPTAQAGRLEILWVRKEQASAVTWAGKPEKLRHVVDGEERISPRKSFAAWRGTTEGVCRPWSSSDQMLASKLLVRVLAIMRGGEDRPTRPGQGPSKGMGQA